MTRIWLGRGIAGAVLGTIVYLGCQGAGTDGLEVGQTEQRDRGIESYVLEILDARGAIATWHIRSVVPAQMSGPKELPIQLGRLRPPPEEVGASVVIAEGRIRVIKRVGPYQLEYDHAEWKLLCDGQQAYENLLTHTRALLTSKGDERQLRGLEIAEMLSDKALIPDIVHLVREGEDLAPGSVSVKAEAVLITMLSRCRNIWELGPLLRAVNISPDSYSKCIWAVAWRARELSRMQEKLLSEITDHK